jgi:hypothetical protein
LCWGVDWQYSLVYLFCWWGLAHATADAAGRHDWLLVARTIIVATFSDANVHSTPQTRKLPNTNCNRGTDGTGSDEWQYAGLKAGVLVEQDSLCMCACCSAQIVLSTDH